MFYITMDDSTGKTLPADPSNRVYQSNQALYWDSNENIFDILDPTLTLEKGKTGSLEFTILPTHTLYNKKIDRLRTIFRVYQLWKKNNGKWSNPVELFKGRVTEITLDMDKKKKIVCEGDLAYLKDSLQPPVVRTDKNKISPKQRLKEILDNHTNSATGGIYLNKSKWNGEEKKFYIGINQLPDVDSKNKAILHTFKTTSYQSTEEAILALVSSYGGWVRTRHKAWKHGTGALANTIHEERYLDYLRNEQKPGTEPQYTTTIGDGTSYYSGQKTIAYGVNLISLEVEWTSDDYFNTLLPTGDSKNQAKGSTALPLTIESVHNAKVITIGEVTGKSRDGDSSIYNHGSYYNAIGRFTRVVKTENFSGVKTASELYEKAKEYLLQNYKEDPDTYTITAIDMIELDQDTLGNVVRPSEPIYIGDIVRLISEPHGIDVYKECTAITYDLTDPAKTEFTLGEEIQKISDQFKDEKSSSGGGGGSKKKTDSSSPTEQGNETQQLAGKTQGAVNSAATWVENTFGVNVPRDENGDVTFAGMKPGDLVSGLVSGDGLTSLAGGLFGGVDVSKYIKNGKVDFSSILSGELGGSDGILNNLLGGDNGILNNLLTGTNGALNDYLKVSGTPSKYPSIRVDDNGKVYIGESWGDTLQNFNIAETEAYKKMLRDMTVSALSNVSVFRKSDGEDHVYPDYINKQSGIVYLPLTAALTQKNSTTYKDFDIEINSKTYIPQFVYDSEDEDKKYLYVVTGLNYNETLKTTTPFYKAAVPSSIYTPDITIENKVPYALTKYGGHTLSKISIAPRYFDTGSVYVDKSSGTETKKFYIKYKYSANDDYSETSLAFPSSWITPSILIEDGTEENTKRAHVSIKVPSGESSTITLYESYSDDITISYPTQVTDPTGINQGAPASVQNEGSNTYRIEIPITVLPSNKKFNVSVPNNVYTPSFSKLNNAISAAIVSGDASKAKVSATASAKAVAGIGNATMSATESKVSDSITAQVDSIIGSPGYYVDTSGNLIRLKSNGKYLPLTARAKVGSLTITKAFDFTVPYFMKDIKWKKNGSYNYAYNTTTHKYTITGELRYKDNTDPNKRTTYASNEVTTGTEAYDAGVTAGKSTAITLTDSISHASSYTSEPKHKTAKILNSTYLSSKTTGTYEFSIGNVWFYFNVGNNPRPQGGGGDVVIN